MKLLKYISFLFLSYWVGACSPTEYSYPDNNVVDLNSITKISLIPNHFEVVADGHA